MTKTKLSKFHKFTGFVVALIFSAIFLLTAIVPSKLVAYADGENTDKFFDVISLKTSDYDYTASDFYNSDYTTAKFNTGSDENENYIGTLFVCSTISLITSFSSANESVEFYQLAEFNYSTQEAENRTPIQIGTYNLTNPSTYSFGFVKSNPTIKKYALIYKQGGTEISTKVFVLVQIATNFNTGSAITYNYSQPGGAVSVSDLTTDNVYPPITMTVPSGTALNPTYVEFTKNGEHFYIYNIEGQFYNQDGTPLDFAGSSILFDISGKYTFSIYDNTYNSSNNPLANHVEDSIYIKNGTGSSAVFVSATNEEGEIVASGEITNSNVTLRFNNVNSSNVNSIKITKRTTSGSIHDVSSDTFTKPNFPSSYLCDEDYQYIVTIQFVDNSTPFEYDFQIIKSIRTSHTDAYLHYYEPHSYNTIETVNIAIERTNTYKYDIESVNTYTYSVKLARSNPSISGITEGGSASGDLNLRVYGVGDITVNVTVNGASKEPVVLKNGDIYHVSGTGRYTVTITDEMGTVTVKHFTIRVQMNTAGLVLIVIGAVIVAAGIFFVIKSRSRVAVR